MRRVLHYNLNYRFGNKLTAYCIHYQYSYRNPIHLQYFRNISCSATIVDQNNNENVDNENKNNRFNMNLLQLLESNEWEKEEFWTSNKLPSIILDELTKDYKRPKMPRIAHKELYTLLQTNSTELMSFANMLQYWIMDENELNAHLKETFVDVNYVDIEKKTKTNNIVDENALNDNCMNDEILMDIMDNEYLSDLEMQSLFDTAMVFFDISLNSSQFSSSPAIDARNRLASIFLILASHLGHIQAQLQLGKQYMLGYGVNKDYRAAIYYFVRSGAQGNVEARAFLGSMYMLGYGVKKNMSRAFELLNEASRLMNPNAQRYLAEMYEKGHDNEPDDTFVFSLAKDHYLALRLAEKATGNLAEKLIEGYSSQKLHNPQFIIEAATIAGRMLCMQSKFEQAVVYFEQAAKYGNADAQCNLGHIFWIGVPSQITPDIYRAVQYLLSAANQGHRRAHRELGMIYCYSDDNEEILNMEEGIQWLDMAGKGGYIDCYFRLAEIYASGNNRYHGVQQNFKIAQKHLSICREESDFSRNSKDKLPEGVWNRVMKDPLQCRTLIDTYETMIGGKWRGNLSDLNPEMLSKIAGV